MTGYCKGCGGQVCYCDELHKEPKIIIWSHDVHPRSLETQADIFIHLPCTDKEAFERIPELAELEALIVKIKDKYGGYKVEIFYDEDPKC